MRRLVLLAVSILVLAGPAAAQVPQAQAPPAPEPIILGPPPPPATALEAFHAAPGAILTVAYEDLGDVAGVFVEAREMRDTGGARVRGVVVTIPEKRETVPDQAFIDPDELPALLKGFDALLAITTSPNGEFRNFDMRFSTKGELVLTASSTRQRGVVYGVEVGRLLRTRRSLNGGEFHQLRVLVEAAQQKLATLRDDR